MTEDNHISLSGTAATAAVLDGSQSAEEIAAKFVQRIKRDNPRIAAIRTSLSDAALVQAQQVDQARKSGKPLGPLAGLPVVVKENCDLAGIVCSAGLAFRYGHVPSADSDIVRRLRAADAVILGTSVSDPGAFSTRTIEVTHPADAALSVGGSSGGSGAGLAAGMCLGAIGTDTGGSIRVPAACCGVAGLKPTFGVMPVTGIFPLTPSLDHVGPMARDVNDVALLWNALGPQQKPAEPIPTRIGYDPSYIEECDASIQTGMNHAIRRWREQGVECVEIRLPDLDAILDMHATIFTLETARWHKTNHKSDLEQYPELARGWFEIAEGISQETYDQANAMRIEVTAQLDAVLEQVGTILTPTLSCEVPDKTAETIDIAGKSLDFTMAMVRQTCLFDHSGHPALAFPLPDRQRAGLPVSAQLIGKKRGDSALLNFAIRSLL